MPNELAGLCLAPMVPHWLMNGESLPGTVAKSLPAASASASRLSASLAQSPELDQRGGKVLLANLVALGYGPGQDIVLDQYLAAARRTRRLSFKKAFRSLLSAMAADVGPGHSWAAPTALVSVVEAAIAVWEKAPLGAVEGQARGGREAIAHRHR